jgi:predicted nucleotidyltransferase
LNNIEIDDFTEKLRLWSSEQPEIQATAIIGSWARGTARADSDIDIIVIAQEPAILLDNNIWLERFGKIDEFVREDWGLVHALLSAQRI